MLYYAAKRGYTHGEEKNLCFYFDSQVVNYPFTVIISRNIYGGCWVATEKHLQKRSAARWLP
jgi:hypothetical protein